MNQNVRATVRVGNSSMFTAPQAAQTLPWRCTEELLVTGHKIFDMIAVSREYREWGGGGGGVTLML